MPDNIIRVGGVETFSTVDFPDKISAVIFMQGCPWRCPFCHNAFLQDVDYDSGFIWEKFVDFLKSRRKLLDGVVFSGGEPLIQKGLSQAIKQVKDMGYSIGLHTGGYNPEHLSQILPLLDWVGMDIKSPFDTDKYSRIIGIPAEKQLPKIKQSLDLLIKSGIDFECRTTCDPRFLDIEDIKNIAEELSSKGVQKYFLQKYRPIESDRTTTDSECEKFFLNQELLQDLQKKFKVFDIRK